MCVTVALYWPTFEDPMTFTARGPGPLLRPGSRFLTSYAVQVIGTSTASGPISTLMKPLPVHE